MDRPKVVIIGAGFGGLQCARSLEGQPIDVLLLDKNNFHLFTPLLYQVASSLLNPSDIAYPIRAVFRDSPNVRFRMGEVVGVDFKTSKVRLSDGSFVPYDYLVLAAGSRTNYFGIESVSKRAHGLKDLPEALALRNHMLRCFESASKEVQAEKRRSWLSFVIVGAGPTGVEYAGALSELVRVVQRDYPELDMAEVRIALIEALAQVLPTFPEKLGRKAQAELERRGIHVRLKTRVVEAMPTSVRLHDGTETSARILIWTAGVKPSKLVSRLGLPVWRSGRIEVDDRLRVKGHNAIYAIGDIASFVQDGSEVPMLATPAIQEARHASYNILRDLRGSPPLRFRYRDWGSMATIGRNAAVARLGSWAVSGLFGWLIWLFVHLYFLIGFRNRLVVSIGWAWDYVRFDRPVRLIARAAKEDGEGPG